MHEVHTWFPVLFRLLSLQSGPWRWWLPMFRCGRALLASGRFDLIYFSTTCFNLVTLGRIWNREFGIPYVIDFQDPWVTAERISSNRGWKVRLSALLDPGMERFAVVNAAGLIAVSDGYIQQLTKRYSSRSPIWLQVKRHAVISFCAIERDFVKIVRKKPGAKASLDRELTLHYIGVGSPTMGKSFSPTRQALAVLRSCGDLLTERVRIRLFGTGATLPADRTSLLQAVACEAGIADIVSEKPERVPYRHALELVLECDGLLIPAADDPAYMPSKLFSYALSGKPIIASVRREGVAFAEFQANQELGQALWFDEFGAMPLKDAAAIFKRFLAQASAHVHIDRYSVLEEHLAPNMAQHHVEVFEACLARAASQA